MSSQPTQNFSETFSSSSYSRITIHLPTATTLEKTAAWFFLNSIILKYDGCTFSEVEDPVYTGKWIDRISLPSPGSNIKAQSATPITDRICIAFVDVPRETRNLRYDEDVADSFWAEARRCYNHVNAGQLAFWVYITHLQIREQDSADLTALKQNFLLQQQPDASSS